MVTGSIQQTTNSNTPSVLTSAGTALAANTARIGWSIQNLGTHALFVRLGPSGSTTVFHAVLLASGSQDDGTGGLVSQTSGDVYTGIITVDGTLPRFTCLEIAP